MCVFPAFESVVQQERDVQKLPGSSDSGPEANGIMVMPAERRERLLTLCKRETERRGPGQRRTQWLTFPGSDL